jgi:hypothetical protein
MATHRDSFIQGEGFDEIYYYNIGSPPELHSHFPSEQSWEVQSRFQLKNIRFCSNRTR